MASFKRFEDIAAWQAARELNRLVFEATNTSGFRQNFDLRGQLRDASDSIMSNIAEGFERGGDKEFHQFLAIAKGSAGELRSRLYGVLDAGLIAPSVFKDLYSRVLSVSTMIGPLMRYLASSPMRGSLLRGLYWTFFGLPWTRIGLVDLCEPSTNTSPASSFSTS